MALTGWFWRCLQRVYSLHMTLTGWFWWCLRRVYSLHMTLTGWFWWCLRTKTACKMSLEFLTAFLDITKWRLWCCRYRRRLLLRRKRALVRTDAITVPLRTTIHASRHTIINTDVEEDTGKFRMERSHWVIDICVNVSKLNELCTWNWRSCVARCPISFEFTTSRTLHRW